MKWNSWKRNGAKLWKKKWIAAVGNEMEWSGGK